MKIQGIHFITENRPPYGHVELARMALEAGIGVIQYRCKDAAMRHMLDEAGRIQALCREHGALLIINDHLDLALALGGVGLHLGQQDMPVGIARNLLGTRAVIGVSVQNLAQAVAAREQGASYLGYGPVFGTVSKADAGPEKGLAALAGFCAQLKPSLPVVALGGINYDNIAEVKRAGASGVAIISAISHAVHPQNAALLLQQKWREMGGLIVDEL